VLQHDSAGFGRLNARYAKALLATRFTAPSGFAQRHRRPTGWLRLDRPEASNKPDISGGEAVGTLVETLDGSLVSWPAFRARSVASGVAHAPGERAGLPPAVLPGSHPGRLAGRLQPDRGGEVRWCLGFRSARQGRHAGHVGPWEVPRDDQQARQPQAVSEAISGPHARQPPQV
jgi:hypothetical protein